MNTRELAGKVAIVTGGAGGIGRATAQLLVTEGASVVIGDVDADAGQDLAREIGAAAAFKQTDVSDADQVQALVDFAVERFGGLDIMFNNAGIGSPLKRFLPDDLEDFSRIMNVNLFGVIVGSQRAARYMKDHGGGSIINNASIAAINAGTGMISYRASKAAIAHASKCMAIDLAPYAIRVNCLTPAHIRTGITTYEMGPVLRYMQPLEREAQPEDVANAVVFLSSDRAAQITGIVLPDRRRHDRRAALRPDEADHVDIAPPGRREGADLLKRAARPCRQLTGVKSRLRLSRPRRKKVGRYS